MKLFISHITKRVDSQFNLSPILFLQFVLASQQKKYAMKMKETNKKKQRMCKNYIHGRKPFITPR